MSPYRRNVIVGVTVLVGLACLGWMMIRFGGAMASPFASRFIDITVTADRGDGLLEGSLVLYRGVIVGRVDKVVRAPDDMSVIIFTEVEQSPPLPRNVRGVIRATGLIGGGASLHLELVGERPEGQLTAGATVEARYAGLDILPPEFAELAGELRQTARQLRESNVVNHLDEQVQRVGKVLDSVQRIIDDPKLNEDLKASLESIRSTTEKTDRIAGKLEQFADDMQKLSGETSQTLEQARGTIGKTEAEILKLSQQMGERLVQVSTLLDQFQSIAQKIDQGQGTAGRLVNDVRLYESLVDTARQLNATIADLRRLVLQWEQEGVYLRMR